MDREPFFRRTNDLRREFHALANSADRTAVDLLPIPPLPGLVLFSGTEFVAAIGAWREPGGVLALSDPAFPQATTDDVRAECYRKLLQESFAVARTDGYRMIRIVQPASAPAFEWEWQLAGEAGFSVRARVTLWSRTSERQLTDAPPEPRFDCSEPGADRGFHEVSLDRFDFADGTREEILALLSQTFTGTQDLVTLPRPVPEDLVADWIRNKAFLITVRKRNTDVALAACIEESRNPEHACYRLQYLGVIPAFRRQGVASRLLRQLPLMLSQRSPLTADHTISLKAFCDVMNQPAMRLYEQCGFERLNHADLDIWCCDLVNR